MLYIFKNKVKPQREICNPKTEGFNDVACEREECGQRTGKMPSPLTDMGATTGKNTFAGQSGFSPGRAKFKAPIIHPRGDVG